MSFQADTDEKQLFFFYSLLQEQRADMNGVHQKQQGIIFKLQLSL